MITRREKELIGYLQDRMDGETKYSPDEMYDICVRDKNLIDIAIQIDIGKNKDVQDEICKVLRRLGMPKKYHLFVRAMDWQNSDVTYVLHDDEDEWYERGTINKVKNLLLQMADPDYVAEYAELKETLKLTFTERRLRHVIAENGLYLRLERVG